MPFDTGSARFMLVAATFVMFMPPGLALFYGGLVRRKDAFAIMVQSSASLCITTLVWYLYGYSMCFS